LNKSQEGTLASFIAATVGEHALRVEESFGQGFVRLLVSEAERRQAKHDIRCVEDAVIELLRNSRDAGARNVFLATTREGDVRSLVCLDDGAGIPSHMIDRVFEARVTSKLDSMHMDQWGVHGRGMALYSIRANSLSANVICSEPGLGTSLHASFDCDKLPERSDQSTWPQTKRDDSGKLVVARGPHNIIRTVVEFALDSRPTLRVYLGSHAEILSTLYHMGIDDVLDEIDTPLILRPAFAQDARELVGHASDLGLTVSERTAYRILNGEIEPLKPVHILARGTANVGKHAVDLETDRRGLKISVSDLEDFTSSLIRSFNVLGDRYYITLASNPRVRIAGNEINVTFSIQKED